MERISIIELVERIPDEVAAYRFLESMRWPDKPVCPHCGSVNDHRFLNPENGTSRRTRTGSFSQRRVWKCRDCKKQFSVITNTPFHGSKVPLRIWIFVLFEMCANKNGIAAREIARKYKLSNKTAWYVTHRVRLAMDSLTPPAKVVGTFVADEAYIGGDPKNRHGGKHGTPGRGTGKTPVFTLINAETGEARSQVIANVNGTTLRNAILESAQPSGSTLWTDKWAGYGPIGKEFSKHVAVDHDRGEYVREGGGTNMAENYFSQLKRSLDGTHHNVSPEHLDRYLAEFDFRYSTRHLDDTTRMARLMGQTAGRRMSYKRITG